MAHWPRRRAAPFMLSLTRRYILAAMSVAAAKTAPRRRRRDTREEILKAAETLWQRRGYNAFSYHHIAVQLGIRNAAIHYHFPGKEDLGVEMIRRYRERFAHWFAVVNEQASGGRRLNSYLQLYLDYLADECKVCPSGILGAEFHSIPEPMRAEAQGLMGEIHEWLTGTLALAQQQQELCFSGDADSKAVQLGASLQGGLQVARIAGPERFYQLLQQLRLELGLEPQRHL